MGRRKQSPAIPPPEPEDESQEPPEDEDDQEEPGTPPAGGTVSKADAVRAALAAGIDTSPEAVAFIKQRFGIEMAKQHFSAQKSQIKRRERESEEVVKPEQGRKPKAAPVQDRQQA